jgi:hypothetical protein
MYKSFSVQVINMPFKPAAVVNYKTIDDIFLGTVVDFWELILGIEDSTIDLKLSFFCQ